MSCSTSRVLFVPPVEPEEIEAAQRGKALPLVRLPSLGDRPGQQGADMPPLDALDPGPLGDYPHLPRNPDGSLDTVGMPVGPWRQLMPDGRNVVLMDVEPTGPHGRRPSEVPPPAA